MASANQGRSRNPGRESNGGLGGGRNEGFEHGQSDTAEMGWSMRERAEAARQEMGRRYRQAEGALARNPMSSVMIGFGLGFGLGLVVTALLGEREHPAETWARRHLPDRLRKFPDSFEETVDQLADSVRRLPDAVRDQLASTLGRR